MKTSRYVSHLGVRSRLARKRWTRRLLFLVGGVCVGLAAIVMAWLADHAQHLFGALVGHWPAAGLLVTPLGFALCMWLAVAVFPNAQGSGIPQVIAALRLPQERRGPLVSLRVGFGKVVVMSLGLLFGASTGREGPTVQVGGAIMAAFGRFAPYRQSGFLLAGSSAGVAAAFNTPLAGIVFAIEELSRSFEMKTSGLVIGAIVAAGLTSLAILGEYHYFGTPTATLPLGQGWFIVAICAVLCGVLGGLFSRIMIAVARGLPGRIGRTIKAHPVLFAGVCGLGVALCGFFSGVPVHGTGYDQAHAIIHAGSGAVDRGYGFWKYVATLLSAISGIPGGIFAPSLAIGAGIAADIAPYLPPVPLDALVLVGMVSYLTGVVRAPITAFVITSEMTNNHAMVIPLMAAALIANGASQLVLPEGLYHALANITLQRFRAEDAAKRATPPPPPAV